MDCTSRSPSGAWPSKKALLGLMLIVAHAPLAAAQACVSIAGSTTCSAFNASLISTSDQQLLGLFPFLSNVTDTRTFDDNLREYASNGYVRSKYQNTFGCSNIDYRYTANLYARYTTSFICNVIVQISLQPCGRPASDFPPLCADSCADFAQSEQQIISTPAICGSPNRNNLDLLRADFANCALPSASITNQCIEAYRNEPDNCGYQNNLDGLCSFCAASTTNGTDSCCVTSNAESRCANVHLPVYSSLQPISFSTTAPSSSPTGSSSTPATSTGAGLTGGQIAGIVIGAIIGAAVLIALIVCCCLFMRRRSNRRGMSSLNQPTPPRSGTTITTRPTEEKFEALPGARVTRMTALEAASGADNSPQGYGRSPGSDTDGALDSSPEYTGLASGGLVIGQRNRAPKSRGSFDGATTSPESNSSPEGHNGHSEQMEVFKDYYSQDNMHPNDLVSVLWAYQPRAGDEFELERGDMLRIVGIWDDGWATAVRVDQRAEDWDPQGGSHRDSGFSGAGRPDDSPPSNGDVKAFPLVCVCLPQHWKKTVDGEDDEGGPSL